MIAKNNPFNIRYSKKNNWFGQTGSRRGFAEFDSFENGLRAGLKLLVNYVRQGYNSIDDIISRYAPPSENDTKRYISFVKKSADVCSYGVDVSVVTYLDVCILAQQILIYENSIHLGFDLLSSIMNKYIVSSDKSIFDSI